MSEPLERPSEKHKWMAWPIVRGVMTLGYAMTLGYRALRFSANVAIEDMMEDDAKTNHVTTPRQTMWRRPPRPSRQRKARRNLPRCRNLLHLLPPNPAKKPPQSATGWPPAIS